MILGLEQRWKLQLGLLLGGVYGRLLSSSRSHLLSAGDWWSKWGLTGTTPYASFRYLWMKLMFNKCSPGCDTVFDLLSWLGGRSSCRNIWRKEPTLWTHSWLDIGQDSVCLPGLTPTLGPWWLLSLVSMSSWVFLFPLYKVVQVDDFGEGLGESSSWLRCGSPWHCRILHSVLSLI